MVHTRHCNRLRVKMMCAALAWRIKRREMLATRICTACSTDAFAHDARLFGADGDGDAIFANCFALPRNLHPVGIANHMACLFERALVHYPTLPSGRRRQWTWCIDIYGFGLRHTDPRTTIELLRLLETAYPERLKRMLVVDAPGLFWALWRVVRPLIQERTAAKIEFVTWAAAPQRYRELFGEQVAERLIADGTQLNPSQSRPGVAARPASTLGKGHSPPMPLCCSRAGLENRDKTRVAAKRWTSFYAADLVDAYCTDCVSA